MVAAGDRCSTMSQRSWTTLMPARASASATGWWRMPDWNHTAAGLRGQHVVEVRLDVLRAPEHVHQVHRSGDVRQPAVHRLAENLGHVRVVHGHGNHVETRPGKIPRHVERRLVALPLRLDPENGDPPDGSDQFPDIVGPFQQVRVVVHPHTVATRHRL